ncbi:Uncharacterised protein [Serratia quinivorans]|uniref:hypothetical protein n=1 Tax=Serratia quinivorans TaxID=137545 RepID=UPI00217C6B93|nr:hypothetical protein [Serratia quinivorans]CAI1723634.1 Uncharacterised protein [Serratia quinivorans]
MTSKKNDIEVFSENAERSIPQDPAALDNAKLAADKAVVVSSNDEIELLRASTATLSNPPNRSVDQDNYYLKLKSGKAITSYELNVECYQGALSTDITNPARPFCTGVNANYVTNGFIWPLGDQQMVATTMFMSAGESAVPQAQNYNLAMSVNEKRGCICLTRLMVPEAQGVQKDNICAYIIYTDSDGNIGQVIVGPTSADNGSTLRIIDLSEMLDSAKAAADKAVVVGSNDEVELLRASIATFPFAMFVDEYEGPVGQDNYYLRLKNGNAITSYTAQTEGDLAALSIDPTNPALPFSCGYNSSAFTSSFIWPLGDQQPVVTTMYSADIDGGYSPLTPGMTFDISVNEKTGCICLTFLAWTPTKGIIGGSGLNNVNITYIDSGGNTGQVTLESNDYGDMLQIATGSEITLTSAKAAADKAVVWDSTSEIELLKADIATIPYLWNSNATTVEQDNYYLRLKNGKAITSITTSSLNLAALSPARPFSTDRHGGYYYNAFIWPLGDQHLVNTTMYGGGNIGPFKIQYFNTGSFSMSVNEKPGCVCLSNLAWDGESFIGVSTKRHDVSITYTDSSGNIGQVIVGPNPADYGKSLSIIKVDNDKLGTAKVAADKAVVVGSNDEVELLRANIATLPNPALGSIDQDNYYLKLKSGKAIKSYTLNAECYQGALNTDLVNPARPFSTGGNGDNVINAFIWPLGTQQLAATSMFRDAGEFGVPLRADDNFTMSVNEKPGCICLTRLSVTNTTHANQDNYYATITYTDSDNNTSDVTLWQNPVDGGNTLLIWDDSAMLDSAKAAADKAVVVDSNSEFDLYEADIATFPVSSLGDVDQDNYYLQLKNGKAITSYTVNSECFQASLTTDSDNLARPFCAMNNGDSIVNAFIWPLGDQQLVDTSVFLGAGESGSKVDFNSESFPMSVNEKSGCICLTRLWVDSSMYATEDNDFKAYITYTDSSGETGQVIVGPNADNSGKTLSILDWTEVFSTVDNMNIEFPEQNGASQAVIYANGRNQVPVKVSLSVRDSNNVSIPLTSEDIAAVSSLTSDGRNNDISELGWNYSSTKGDFVKATYDTQMSRGVTANTIDTGTNLVYVSCPRRVQSSITIAYTVTINGTQYSTSTYQSNYDSIQLLYIEAMPEKLLQYRGSNTHDAADGDSDFIFHEEYVGEVKEFYDNNHPAKQYNSYISLASGDHIVKANTFYHGNYVSPDKTSYINWARRSANGKVANCLVFPLGNPHTVKVDVSYYAQRYYYEINVNQRGPGELCLTTIVNNDIHIDSGELIGNAPIFVELFDTSGNKGYIALIELDGNLSAQICNGDYY